MEGSAVLHRADSEETMELWDIYDIDRQKTGKLAQRVNGKSMPEGEYHLVAVSYTHLVDLRIVCDSVKIKAEFFLQMQVGILCEQLGVCPAKIDVFDVHITSAFFLDAGTIFIKDFDNARTDRAAAKYCDFFHVDKFSFCVMTRTD